MPWDGSGNINLVEDFQADRDAGPPDSLLSADKFMNMFNDLAGAIEACLNRNGENALNHNIDCGAFKFTNSGEAAGPNEIPRSRQIAENTISYCGLTTGTAGAYVVANNFISALAVGTVLRATASATNTAAATLTFGATTANIVEKTGSNIAAARITSGDPFSVFWDGTHFVLIEAGTQSYDNTIVQLKALAPLLPATDTFPYNTSDSDAALTALTSFARTILDDADQDTARATLGCFPAGTMMSFFQTSAPTGWTKSTTHDNKIPRIVSGSASSGGSTAFSDVFKGRTIAQANLPNFTLGGTTSNDGAHTHITTIKRGGAAAGSGKNVLTIDNEVDVNYTSSSAGAHSHTITTNSINGNISQTTIDFAVQYVDMILATRN